MDEILRLVQQNNIVPAEVEKVDVGGDRIDVETLFHHRPTTALEGKFSMEFLFEHPVVGTQSDLKSVHRCRCTMA